MTYKRKEIIGDCTLYLGDCMEVMQGLDKVDAVVTDPPYFKVKGEFWDNQWKDGNKFCEWLGGVLDSCSAIMEDWASVYCFASPQMEWRVQGLVRERFVFLNSIRWVKENGWHKKQKTSDQRVFQQNWEACLFAQKSNDSSALVSSGYDSACKELHKKVYSPIGDYFKEARESLGVSYRRIAEKINRDPALYLRWEEGSSLPNPVDYEKCRLLGLPLRLQYEELRLQYEELRRPFSIPDDGPRSDVWKFDVVSGYKGKHPCEKPKELMEHIIKTSTKQAQTILDPFMGSGTTLVACAKMQRKGIGIELDPDYFDIACKRVEDAYRQPSLFQETTPKLPEQTGLDL